MHSDICPKYKTFIRVILFKIKKAIHTQTSALRDVV